MAPFDAPGYGTTGRQQYDPDNDRQLARRGGGGSQGRDYDRYYSDFPDAPSDEDHSILTVQSGTLAGPNATHLLAEVDRLLVGLDEIDAAGIQVSIEDCEVTLCGSIGNRHLKRVVTFAIEQIPGVRCLHNRLHTRYTDSDHALARYLQREHEADSR